MRNLIVNEKKHVRLIDVTFNLRDNFFEKIKIVFLWIATKTIDI